MRIYVKGPILFWPEFMKITIIPNHDGVFGATLVPEPIPFAEAGDIDLGGSNSFMDITFLLIDAETLLRFWRIISDFLMHRMDFLSRQIRNESVLS